MCLQIEFQDFRDSLLYNDIEVILCAVFCQRLVKRVIGGSKLVQYIQNFLKFRPLLSELVARDIKIKYRRSVLGVLWTILNPLFMMIVLSVVFSNLFRFDIENFPVYLLSGQVIFNFFNDTTTTSMGAIIGNGSLIKKIYVPKYLFVLSIIPNSYFCL